MQCALLKREPYQLSYRIRCADGRIKDVWETGVGVYSSSGEVLGIEGAIFERRP
ncbi:PAS fold protein [compost metagenome]